MFPLQSGRIAERENAVTITTGSQFFLQYIVTDKYCEEKVNILEFPRENRSIKQRNSLRNLGETLCSCHILQKPGSKPIGAHFQHF